MKKRWIRGMLAFLLVVVLLTTPCLADTVGGAVVKGTGVRLRSGTDTSGSENILTEMTDGAFLLVEEQLNGWYKVIYNGVEGYVSADYASFSESIDRATNISAVTKGTNINMRSAATVNSVVVKTLLNSGTSLTIMGVSGKWLKVKDVAGTIGYIRSDLLHINTNTITLGLQSKGQQLVQTALQYRGYRYTWGGKSPATGFDCSGFANYVCEQNGISLHRVAQDIYSNDGVWVSKDQLQPGDLVFFGYGPYSVTHMGIYVGDGQMIHASTSTTGVIYSDINSNYYTRMYVGAKRVA